MSSIPPNINIVGAFSQTQVSAGESAKTQDADRNKRARDAKELAKLVDQQQHEVETTAETENLRVHREGEDASQRQNNRDTYENTHPEDTPKLYASEGSVQNPPAKLDPSASLPNPDDEPDPSRHIDLSI